MQKTHFESIQFLLCDPTLQGSQNRECLAASCSVAQVGTGVLGVASAASAVFGLILCPWYPILGGVLAVSGVTAAAVSRDVYVIAKNCEDILEDSLIKVVNRVGIIWTAQLFVNVAFKNTYFIGPIFGSLAVRVLNTRINK